MPTQAPAQATTTKANSPAPGAMTTSDVLQQPVQGTPVQPAEPVVQEIAVPVADITDQQAPHLKKHLAACVANEKAKEAAAKTEGTNPWAPAAL